jgi:transposase
LAIARVSAASSTWLPVLLAVGAAADLRALLDYREDLIEERSALANRAHAELSGRHPGYQHSVPNLTSKHGSRRR